MEDNKMETPKSRRGFASMSEEKQRQIASQGGKAAHVQGVAHEWSKDEAREAGRKGGKISGEKRKNQRDTITGPIL